MNLALLNEKIQEISIPKTVIAERIGISTQSLYLKLTGKRDFKMSEAKKLGEVLRLTNAEKSSIFFEE